MQIAPFNPAEVEADADAYFRCYADVRTFWALEDATSMIEAVKIVRTVIPHARLHVAKRVAQRIRRGA